MKFCGNCGNQMNDNERFCSVCGAPAQVEQAAPVPPQGMPIQQGMPVQQPVRKAPKKKVNPVTWIIIGAAALVALILLIVIIALIAKPKTVKLDKYISVEFYGIDGDGYASWDFDEEAFEKDYKGKLKLTRDAKKALKYLGGFGDLTDDVIMEAYEDAIWGYLDESYDLSNGDEVVFTYSLDSELRLYFKNKLKYSEELKFTVENLGAYITAMSDITEDSFMEMREITEQAIDDNIYADGETLEEASYLGYYYMKLNAKDQYATKNYVVVVYKVRVSHDDQPDTVYFYYNQFQNITVTADGKANTWDEYIDTPWSTAYSENGNFYYTGYEDFEDLEEDIYWWYEDNYKIENAVSK